MTIGINNGLVYNICILFQIVERGDKNLFIGEVIEAYADEAIVKGEKKIEYAKGEFPRKIYSTRFKVS